MLDRPSNLIFEHKISYPIKVKSPYLHRVDFTQEGAAERFVIRYGNMLFFTKHKHWEHEREYRFVSKHEYEIGITNAITGIYVLGVNNFTLDRIEEIVKDDSLINFLIITGTEDRHLESINLKWYRETLEFLNNQ